MTARSGRRPHHAGVGDAVVDAEEALRLLGPQAVLSHETPLIQQVHIVAAHIICGLVEQKIFGGKQ